MRVRLTLRSGNSASRPQLCGVIKRPLGPRRRHCAHAHARSAGAFSPARPIALQRGGGSNSRRVRSFCFDSIARDVPLPPQSSARLFAQKAEAGSAPPPQFIVTAATIELPTRKPEPGAGRGRATRSFHLSFQQFVWFGGKLHLHAIKLERSQARQNTGCELRSARQSGGDAVKSELHHTFKIVECVRICCFFFYFSQTEFNKTHSLTLPTEISLSLDQLNSHSLTTI